MKNRKLILLGCVIAIALVGILGYTFTRNKITPGEVNGVSLEGDSIYFNLENGSRLLFAENGNCAIKNFKEEYADGYHNDSDLELFKQRLYEGTLSILSYKGSTLTYQINEADTDFYSAYVPKLSIQLDTEKKQLVVLTPGTEPEYGTVYIDFMTNQVSDEVIDEAKTIQLSKTNIVIPLTDEEMDRVTYVTPMLYDVLSKCYGVVDLDLIN